MEKQIKLKDASEAQAIFGPKDKNLIALENEFGVKITLRGENLKICGNLKDVTRVYSLLEHIIKDIRSGRTIGDEEIQHLMRSLEESKKTEKDKVEKLDIGFSFKGKTIGPKTATQREYVQAIKDYDIVFGLGPAGTGKTYLAMAMAVEALKKGYMRRIILTRPALEAGESLGYLPGTLYEKILPYLRPLYDALYDMMETQGIEKYIEMGTIEVAPLAYMRGRTLNDAFIVLDEAQNCTSEQLKMFLTRLGFDSKTVITGDVSQSDLPGGKPIGLLLAIEILKEIEGIKFVTFNRKDVVRHEIVQKIIAAYEKLPLSQNLH